MRRREFVTIFGGTVALWPIATHAQQSSSKIPVVGVLWHAGSAQEEEVYLSVLQKAFADLGYVDGRNIHLEHRFPAENPDRFRTLAQELIATSPAVPVMRFEPIATTPRIRTVPTRLVEPNAAHPASAVKRRQFVLNSGICGNRAQAGAHAEMVALIGINGKTHDMSRIDVETQLGTSEIWEIVSIGMAHPFHIHGASFRVLSINGAPPAAHLAGWKDVVLVEDKAELFVALNRPATRDHPFMYHCHILEHEDAGLMGQYVCA